MRTTSLIVSGLMPASVSFAQTTFAPITGNVTSAGIIGSTAQGAGGLDSSTARAFRAGARLEW